MAARAARPTLGALALAPALAATALALALVGMLALPPGAGQVGILALIVVGGVPHGALDAEVARPHLRPRWGRWWFAAFAVPYLALAALVLLAWRAAPLPTLAGFLAISAWHFGEEEAPGRPVAALAVGALPIAAPTLLRPDATAGLLGAVALHPLAAPPPWLWAASWGWVALVAWWLARGPARAAVLGAAALALDFALLPPLAAFALFFAGTHAPRHMARLAADPARAPRVTDIRSAVLRSLPVTALTLALGAALWPLFPGPAPDRLLALTIQGLAALTLPHMVLDRLLAVTGRGPRPRPAPPPPGSPAPARR